MANHLENRAGRFALGGELSVCRLGFGAMRIVGPGVWGEPKDRGEALSVLRRAVQAGVNFIDTADSYGPYISEELIAEALRPYPEDLVIATKGGWLRTGPDRWVADGRPEHLREACEGSLSRLHLEQITLYQLHVPDKKVPFEESVGAIAELQREGKVGLVGLSNVSVEELRTAQRIVAIASVQNRYNISDRRSDELVDICARESIAFLPWGPILDLDDNPALDRIAKRHGAAPRQVVISWLLQRSPSMIPIPGTGSLSHLEENLVGPALDPNEVAELTGS